MVNRADALKQIAQAQSVAATVADGRSPGDAQGYFVTTTLFSVIERFIRPGSHYEKTLAEIRKLEATSYPGFVAPRLAGVLAALKLEIEGGYLETLTQQIRGEEFSDFISMAEHLFSEGYKDPAAVIAGSVLERHLRALSDRNTIDVLLPDGRYKKADSLNADLAKADVYGKTMQKNVVSWLGLRNDAAHGDYGKYEAPNVRVMIDGVLLFISQHPA